jgi:hypothetical protein
VLPNVAKKLNGKIIKNDGGIHNLPDVQELKVLARADYLLKYRISSLKIL